MTRDFFFSQLTVIAGAAGPEARGEEAGHTLETLMQSISRQMVTSFYQGTVCGESAAVQLVSRSPFVCTVEAT